jgi:putative transposase
MKAALKRHGWPTEISTDGMRSYKTTMAELGNTASRRLDAGPTTGLSTAAFHSGDESERAIPRFRQMKSLHTFASAHANVDNPFNLDCHLIDRQSYKIRRSATLAEWQSYTA